jgi:hypothetical protein
MMTMTPLPVYTQDEVRKHRRALIEALRSGRYQQGHQGLRPSASTYCCLGVVEDLRGCHWEPRVARGDYHVINRRTGINSVSYLSREARDWLGVTTNDPWVYIGDPRFVDVRTKDKTVFGHNVTTLSRMNDSRVPFALIADVLEAQADDWDGDQESTMHRDVTE